MLKNVRYDHKPVKIFPKVKYQPSTKRVRSNELHEIGNKHKSKDMWLRHLTLLPLMKTCSSCDTLPSCDTTFKNPQQKFSQCPLYICRKIIILRNNSLNVSIWFKKIHNWETPRTCFYFPKKHKQVLIKGNMKALSSAYFRQFTTDHYDPR